MKLKARSVSFENMIKMINDMVTLLGKEQVDDGLNSHGGLLWPPVGQLRPSTSLSMDSDVM